ncbi:MAG: prephenate dehydrogenase/arogenate dehydrogenase family protein [Chloroflexi bacterium]|nr:prephenate dehydrogenase/arogenate dehydrogenase family protein [Chloroflexota bacterium]MCA2000564.1 prephenate dehydrogenase/arogenate dehydrogenase family protein [Chloroflexota bacterium]
MTTQITIIGLGQIGASMGLALAAHKGNILRVGHDLKREVEREALQKGAADKMEHNLPAAVRDAKLVALCVPASQALETLEFIAPDLQEGAVVLDVSPVKAAMQKWAAEALSGRYYLGLTPSLNPELLHEFGLGLTSARADLFLKGIFLVTPARGVPEAAVALAMDFVRLLGAEPVLADPLEADGLSATVHLLPQLLSASLLNATIDQPGWADARKVAGRAYAVATSGLAYHDEINSLKTSVFQNRSAVVHALDVTLAALRGLRDDIENENHEGVEARLDAAVRGRQRWLGERLAADWGGAERNQKIDIPSFSERFFGGLAMGRKRGK